MAGSWAKIALYSLSTPDSNPNPSLNPSRSRSRRRSRSPSRNPNPNPNPNSERALLCARTAFVILSETRALMLRFSGCEG